MNGIYLMNDVALCKAHDAAKRLGATATLDAVRAEMGRRSALDYARQYGATVATVGVHV